MGGEEKAAKGGKPHIINNTLQITQNECIKKPILQEAAASFFAVDRINIREEITTLCSATHLTDFPLQTLTRLIAVSI